jgi:M6 family metalloprotease-like protein
MRPVRLIPAAVVFGVAVALSLDAAGPRIGDNPQLAERSSVTDNSAQPTPLQKKFLESWKGDVTTPLAGVIDESHALADTQGVQRTIVILVNFRDRSVPIDKATAQKLIFEDVTGFWRTNAFGKVSLEGTVVGPFLVSGPISSRESLRDRAIEAARSTVDFSRYPRIIIFSPWDGDIQATIGKETIRTTDATMTASVSYDNVSGPVPDYQTLWNVVSHEFGHNLGFRHSYSMDCPTCDVEEAGDPFDIMAGASRHTNAVNKARAGWLSNTTTATDGQYVLGPLEVAGSNPQQITVPLSSGDYYSLEFRQPLNYDQGLPSECYSGVVMYLVKRGGLVYGKRELDRNVLVNYRKQGKNDKIPLLQVGRPFRDTTNNVSIALERIDSDGAHLRISGGSASGTAPQSGSPRSPGSGSCYGSCGKQDPACACDEGCAGRGDCCGDYSEYCGAGTDAKPGSRGSGTSQDPKGPGSQSPSGEPTRVPKEPSEAPSSSGRTQTPQASEPGLCQGHCGGRSGNCWCDPACIRAGDCCADYRRICAPPL